MADGMKTKRKDLDYVNDDFSNFSLSSPARKIRRLDMELPPIMEEEETEIGPVVDQPSLADSIEEDPPMIDSGLKENPQRALVVFKYVNTHSVLQHSPSNFTVDSDFISGFKKQYLWSSCSDNMKSAEEEGATTNNSMAVVPRVPGQFPLAQGMDLSQGQAPELMDADQVGESAMEIEGDASEALHQRHEHGLDESRVNAGFLQWQQQHCLIPQLPYSTSTSISWTH